MECTQRLECTQEAYDSWSQKTCPEQIGFLGICGSKQPIKKGPNKIGRDPTCSIVLNDNSISRQHAVINILNKKDFMLMDLDSSNKTKLLDKTLQPYIPHRLQNGDTVQFGQVFGIFRLLEEDEDLPMTQVVEIPDTPVNPRHMSRLKDAPVTTIPESPDVSDKDDSMIAQSQPRKKSDFNSKNNFIKSSGKIIGIQQVGTNKIDNVYWNSSKKSDSFSSNFESNSEYTINKSPPTPKKLSKENSIYDMETQAPARVQIDRTTDSIYEANTQVPSNRLSPTIYSCDTQVPNIEKLPELFKVRDQNNVRLNLYSINDNIFDAETQVILQDKGDGVKLLSSAIAAEKKGHDAICTANKKLNSSDEEICFNEIDCQNFEDEGGSQPLLPPDPGELENLITPITDLEITKTISSEKNKPSNSASVNDSKSKDSTRVVPSRLVPEKPTDDEDVTDCEDNMIELAVNINDRPNKIQSDDDATDCEDDVIEISQNRLNAPFQDFADLPTQVIRDDLTNLVSEEKSETGKDVIPFEDMPTQVIEVCPIESNIGNDGDKSVPFEDLQTQVIDVVIPQEQSCSMRNPLENNYSFKRPVYSPVPKRKYATSLKTTKSKIKVSNLKNEAEEEQNYYDATQEILNDLCTQSEPINNLMDSKIEKNNISVENNIRERSSYDSGGTDKNRSINLNLPKEQVREVIGSNTYIAPLSKKKSSDSSDLEVTPKKFNISKFLMIDLPNSQDIKSCEFVSSKIRQDTTDSSDGFEETQEEDNNKNNTALSFHCKRKKNDIKVDLMKKFDMNTLPTRAITRIRRPTSKILDSDRSTKKMSDKILQSNLGLEKGHEFDGEVIQLNLKRLRNKMERAKNKTISSRTNTENAEGDVLPKNVQLKQSSETSDKNESKKHKSIQKHDEEIKQRNNKSTVKERSPASVKNRETCKDNKTEIKDSSRKNLRSSRNKSKGSKTESKVKKDNSVSCKTTSHRTHHSHKEIQEIVDLTEDKDTVLRRSKRQQNNKNNIEDKKEKSRNNKEKKDSNKSEKSHTVTSESINNKLARNNELSAVYNVSSETAVESPTTLKRQATSELFPSNSKKTRTCNATRATPMRGIRTQHVLFTAFPSEEVKLKLEKLGAVIASDVKSCTVVLTMQIKRTFKLLCALGLGKPIVGPNWVQACADSNMIVDPWLYLMKDEATEKRFSFNLRQSLTCKRKFLKGYNISCTPNVTPSPQEMRLIVECSGGTWKEGGRSWFCVSCPADKALWPGFRSRGATIVTTEFILGGVLQQRINLVRDRLG